MIGMSLAGMTIGAGSTWLIYGLTSPRKSLTQQVIPHVATRDNRSPRSSILTRFLPSLLRIIEQLGSTRSAVERRLAVIGQGSVSDFRLTQIQWAGAGLLVGGLVGIAFIARGYSPAIIVLTVILGALGAALWVDSRLTTKAKRTSRMFTRQLPDVIELVALAVGAGQAIRPALERVVQLGQGPLIEQFQVMLSHVHAGSSLAQALAELSVRADNRNVSRFTDSLIMAMEQGGGLAQTLHHQARDARDAARRELLEEGGKAEISMMIPVVFLILPITILFTIFPALHYMNFH
ncbi:type II secretion system F family protein [Arcanobacterium buesumense]|uniref:Type II secretion system F family protein n=1 Tax=Arcanobacterium buesumense TaxID=2722751 RepID=A0A6H2EM62_9ACTO|nr:type II secretion system F family protein [Arcanobacterium buesumense]QJC22163.1 type II secretion system F family protein [Arcanobacterium buesumense]